MPDQRPLSKNDMTKALAKDSHIKRLSASQEYVFWLLLLIPFFKKLLFLPAPFLVSVLSALSIVSILRFKIRTSTIPYVLIILIYLMASKFDKSYLYILGGILPFAISRLFDKTQHNQTNAIFLLSVVVYAIWQNFTGYTQFEIAWFESGIGGAGTGYLAFEDIRPMSFLAGAPELAFLMICFSFYYLAKQRCLIALIFGALVIFVGVRGLIIGYLTGLFCCFLNFNRGRYSYILVPLVLTPILYVLMYLLSETLSQYTGQLGRISVYGTFLARANIIIDFIASNSISSIIFGIYSEAFVYDNFWLVLVDKFGIIGVIFFLVFVHRNIKSSGTKPIVVTYISYAFFADVGYYFYFSLIIVYFDNLFSKSEVFNAPNQRTGEIRNRALPSR